MSDYAIRFDAVGGPEVLKVVAMDVPAPGPGQIQIKHLAIGVNFIDTYHRTGLYPLPLPSGIGLEASGIVEAVGDGVTSRRAGDLVAYATGPLGAYSTRANVPADRTVRVPEGVDPMEIATGLLKGMTAQYLLKRTFHVKRGDPIVVHAAAGGVGQILCQWGAALGANVIGVVGTENKRQIAKDAGAHHVLVRETDNVVARVKEIAGPEGVPVVYDGVGRDTWMESLDCLAPLGMMVSYGNASGAVHAFEPSLLSAKGSLFLTRPTLMHYTRTAALLDETAADLFDAIKQGHVKLSPPREFGLSEAAEAHRELEGRAIAGTAVLIP
jgi:NADPH:quinone reductase